MIISFFKNSISSMIFCFCVIGVLWSEPQQKIIRLGLYIQFQEDQHANAMKNGLSIDQIVNHKSQEIFLFDGEYFRASGGLETEKGSKPIPFQEYYFCEKQVDVLCNNDKYINFHKKVKFPITQVAADGAWFIEEKYFVDDKKNSSEKLTTRWVRINDSKLAYDYSTRMGILALFPRKIFRDFGYEEPLPHTGQTIFTTANLNLREGPGKTAKSLASLKKGEQLTVVEVTTTKDIIDKMESAWLRVKTTKGKEGYVFGGYVTAL